MTKLPENKRTFKAEIDGETVEIAVVRPSALVSNEAQMHYQSAWSDALGRGCIMQKKLNDHMVKQGLWDDEKQREHDGLVKAIQDGEAALATGKIKLTEGYDIAVRKMRQARMDMQILLAERNLIEQNSAEGIAEQGRFNFLVSKCVLNNETGAPIFSDVTDYLTKSENTWAFQAAAIFSQLNNGVDADFLGSLPENKFLKMWGFVNDDFQLVDKDDNLVDEDGKSVNEFGQWVDGDGDLVDITGKKLDSDGNLVISEDAIFYDDDGNPVVPPKPKVKKDESPVDGVQSSVDEDIPTVDEPDEKDLVGDLQK